MSARAVFKKSTLAERSPGQLVVGRRAAVAGQPFVSVHDDEGVNDVVRPELCGPTALWSCTPQSRHADGLNPQGVFLETDVGTSCRRTVDHDGYHSWSFGPETNMSIRRTYRRV